MDNKVSVFIDDLDFTPTAHNAGLKKILFSDHDALSSLTQFAYGKLPAGEIISSHQHDTMNEYFYFLKGDGYYTLNDQDFAVHPGIAIRIPAGAWHSLKSDNDLEFVYFGIATDKDSATAPAKSS